MGLSGVPPVGGVAISKPVQTRLQSDVFKNGPSGAESNWEPVRVSESEVWFQEGPTYILKALRPGHARKRSRDDSDDAAHAGRWLMLEDVEDDDRFH